MLNFMKNNVFTKFLKNKEYVFVRDNETRFIYAGFVKDFSESPRALVLENVIVYDFEFREKYKLDNVYLSEFNKGMTIEVVENK